eukprot:360591-Chlamydomonas_euryale.AAC.13
MPTSVWGSGACPQLCGSGACPQTHNLIRVLPVDSAGLIVQAVAVAQPLGLPVYVLIRPRGGDFVYNHDELGHTQRSSACARHACKAQGLCAWSFHDNAVPCGDRVATMRRPTFHDNAVPCGDDVATMWRPCGDQPPMIMLCHVATNPVQEHHRGGYCHRWEAGRARRGDWGASCGRHGRRGCDAVPVSSGGPQRAA